MGNVAGEFVIAGEGLVRDMVFSRSKKNYTWGPEFMVLLKNSYNIEELLMRDNGAAYEEFFNEMME